MFVKHTPIYSEIPADNVGMSLSSFLKIRLCARICRDLDPEYPSNPSRDSYRNIAREKYNNLVNTLAKNGVVLGVNNSGKIRILVEINGDWILATATLDPASLMITVESIDLTLD
jgi:hypothetical protein